MIIRKNPPKIILAGVNAQTRLLNIVKTPLYRIIYRLYIEQDGMSTGREKCLIGRRAEVLKEGKT